MTRHPQKRLQLWSQRGSYCVVDCSMSHYTVNIYVSTLTFCLRVKTCAWQPRSPGVKLLEELCLYLSVSIKAIFAQQGFFLRCHVVSFSEGVVRDHCRVIRPLHQTLSASDKTAPTQPWKLHSVSLALIPSPSLRKLPSRKQRICIPHLSLSSWQSNAAPQTKISEEKRKEKLLLICSLLRKNQIKPIDLITRRLRTLMVIARYKCAGKGTDSPKVKRLKVSSIYKLWVRISWKVFYLAPSSTMRENNTIF